MTKAEVRRTIINIISARNPSYKAPITDNTPLSDFAPFMDTFEQIKYELEANGMKSIDDIHSVGELIHETHIAIT